MLKRFRLVSLLFLAFSLVAAPDAHAKKPLSPLRISIVPAQEGLSSGDIKPGDIVKIVVTARSFIDTQTMRIEVKLNGGATLVSGDTSWSGPAAKNEVKTIVLTVQAPKTGKGTIRAMATIPSSDGARFSTATLYVLGPAAKTNPEDGHPVKKDGKGRNVVEYH